METAIGTSSTKTFHGHDLYLCCDGLLQYHAQHLARQHYCLPWTISLALLLLQPTLLTGNATPQLCSHLLVIIVAHLTRSRIHGSCKDVDLLSTCQTWWPGTQWKWSALWSKASTHSTSWKSQAIEPMCHQSPTPLFSAWQRSSYLPKQGPTSRYIHWGRTVQLGGQLVQGAHLVFELYWTHYCYH